MGRSRAFCVVFLLLNLLLSAYFLDAWLTPNAASRALPVLTLYEQGAIRIDDYHRFTADKALIDGHYYSDKAPLSTLVVYPFYRIYRLFVPEDQEADLLARYPIYIWEPITRELDGRLITFPKLQPVLLLGSFLCGSVPFLLLLFLLFLTLVHASPGGSPSPVTLSMLGLYGSYLFVLSGTYFGSLLAGALLLGAYHLLKQLGSEGRECEGRSLMWAGGLTGLATLAEFTCAVAVPIWCGLLYFRRRTLREVALFIAGGIPPLLVFLAYNSMTTGSLIDLPYRHEATEEFAQMREVAVGFGWPSWEALWGLTVSRFRGIFHFAPVLLPIGYLFLLKARRRGGAMLVDNYLVLPAAAHFLIVSCFYMWWGGWSYGPRHLAPLVFLILFEGLLQLSRRDPSRGVFLALGLWGLLTSWMAKATRVYMMPADVSDPLLDLMLPDLLAQKLNANSLPTLFLGLPPLLSVMLWPVIFALCWWILSAWQSKLQPPGTQGQ